MTRTYSDKAPGNTFMDLVEDDEFKQDLVRFFSGGRYSLSQEEMRELGYEGLAEKFVTHMRWQSTNEWTAGRDLTYVMKDKYNEDGKQAFGHLMEAYDNSDGGGTGFWGGVGDYGLGTLASPSTVVTVGTLGFGVGAKLAARGASATTQVAIRKAITDLISKGLTREAAEAAITQQVKSGAFDATKKFIPGFMTRTGQRTLPGSGLKEAARSAGVSFGVEGTLGGATTAATEETRRQTIEGYDYGWGDIVQGAIVQGTIGAGLGGVGGWSANRGRNRTWDAILKRAEGAAEDLKKAREATAETLGSGGTGPTVANATVQQAADRTVSLFEALDPDLVMKGDDIRSRVLTSVKTDTALSPRGYSMDTIRGITAATVEIIDTLDIKPGERISSAVYRAIESGDVTSEALNGLGKKYGLSQEELGLVWLSDLSEAGRTLGEASAIKARLKAAGTDVDILTRKLRETGVASPADETVRRVSEAVGGESTLAWMARQTDQASIAFMTTQIGTTMANIVGTGFNTAANMSDEVFKGMMRGFALDKTGATNHFRGVFDVVRGLSISGGDARILQFMIANDKPDTFERVFFDTLRSDGMVKSDSFMLRTARNFNFLNNVSDAVFKRGVFYGELNRALREQGSSVREFIDSGRSLDDLPPGVFDRAVEKAREITMQKQFTKEDGAFGQASWFAEKTARNIPFLMSQAVGTPFPRYLANHLKYINDYTPIVGLPIRVAEGITGMPLMPKQSAADFYSKQLTGVSLMSFSALMYEEGVLVDYDELSVPGGGENGETISLKRALGPWMVHLYLGEMLGRYLEGQDGEQIVSSSVFKDALDLSLGMTDLGADLGLVGDIIGYAQNPSPTKAEVLGRSLGRFASTFTYPAAPVRDIVGQFNPDSVVTPFTRVTSLGGEDEVLTSPDLSAFGARFGNEVTRFLPDMRESFQLVGTSNSRENGYSMPYYTLSNPDRLGDPAPLSKQFGMEVQRRRTGLERELLDLNMNERDLERMLPKSGALNYLVRAGLSQTLYKSFETWKDQVVVNQSTGQTYSELTDTNERRFVLENFYREAISIAREEYTNGLVRAANDVEGDPALARRALGFIRESFFVDYKNEDKKRDYLMTIKGLTGETYEDPEEYFSASGSIEEELTRRMNILSNLDRSESVTGTGFERVLNLDYPQDLRQMR